MPAARNRRISLPRLTGEFRLITIAASGDEPAWRRSEQEPIECDVLVVGSGCGGLSAAVTAGHHGLNVLIVEKEPRFGGTTARSGGWLWIPGTSLAKAWGIVESPGTGADLSAP